jgi:glycolate dehydrogenase iron-sulfur subunit
MQHGIPVEHLGPHGPHMARAVEACVHCGFCLPTCPTYRVLGEEMDSPRGRIVLMKQALEGELTIQEVLPFIDRCLGCVACVSACPSGVRYGELLIPFRAKAQSEGRSAWARARQLALIRTMESPALFRAAVRGGQLARRLGALLPSWARQMTTLLPNRLEPPAAHPEVTPAAGTRRARVALLAGCVQQVLSPEINSATIRVLTAFGVEVVVPQGQGCCGALALHSGLESHARLRAEALFDSFPDDVDAIVTNAAGCGSAMKEYGELFAGTPLEDRATRFSARVRDVSEFLEPLARDGGPSDQRSSGSRSRTLALPSPLTIAYHDACHLAHAQKVRNAPRSLLANVQNLTVREVPDAEICCGSAGLYNLEQPDIAASLGAAKARAVASTGAEAVVMGNLGCMVQIAANLEHTGTPLPVMHTMELLDRALLRRDTSGRDTSGTGL